eukprot:TRINITY_DN76785_c0_g1_i1.p1 TRINITY_DN76785_c0_g1~~TRINITY_DN76785_c0_g1_i1.p1  ORF type:complete len:506 (-),score=62.89 TRINITY_DN76785_c0_g1_i1:8-1525(-)
MVLLLQSLPKLAQSNVPICRRRESRSSLPVSRSCRHGRHILVATLLSQHHSSLRRRGLLRELRHFQQLKISREAGARGHSHSRVGLWQCALLTCALLTWGFSGASNEAVGLFLPKLLRDFTGVLPAQMAIVSSVFTLGTAVGVQFAGPLGDSHGRRFIGLLGTVGATLAAILATCSTSFLALVFARFMMGFCAGMFTVAIPTLIAECCQSELAESALALYPVGWPLGALACGMLAAGSWRSGLGGTPLLCCIPAALLFAALPESPQFLSSKGRDEEANRAAKRFGLELQDNKPEASVTAPNSSETTKMPAFFAALAAALFLRAAASQTLKVWLPVWLAGSGDPARSFFMMYVVETLGILSTAALVAMGSGSSPDDQQSRGDRLVRAANINLIIGGVSAMGCLCCTGRWRGAGGILGGAHLIAQANVYNLLVAFAAQAFPTQSRARWLSRLNILSFIGGSSAPLLLGLLVRPQGTGLAGVQWVILGTALLYACAFAAGLRTLAASS